MPTNDSHSLEIIKHISMWKEVNYYFYFSLSFSGFFPDVVTCKKNNSSSFYIWSHHEYMTYDDFLQKMRISYLNFVPPFNMTRLVAQESIMLSGFRILHNLTF